MTINLEFVRETDLARLYRRKDGQEIWLPRSIINHTTKWPPNKEGQIIHEIEVPDWKAKELEL